MYRAEARVAAAQVSLLELDALAQTLRTDFAWPFTVEYARWMRHGAGGHATPSLGAIVLGDANHSPFDLLHEFAHLVAERVHAGQRHGPLWVALYVELVRRYMGPAYAYRLLDEFEDARVRWAAPAVLFRWWG